MYVCYLFYYKNEQVSSKNSKQQVQNNSRQFFTADSSAVKFPAHEAVVVWSMPVFQLQLDKTTEENP